MKEEKLEKRRLMEVIFQGSLSSMGGPAASRGPPPPPATGRPAPAVPNRPGGAAPPVPGGRPQGAALPAPLIPS